MRISCEWLREFVDLDMPVETLVDRLPGVGLGVEAVEGFGEDTVLDLEVTSNRPDCMSLLGVAREIALLFDRPLRSPGDAPGASPPRAGSSGTESGASHGGSAAADVAMVKVRDTKGCPRFTAAVIEDVRVGPSPMWMQRRLEACGVRAINSVVDITNYVMLELGQPMHAFDYARVAGPRLIIRRARAGEVLVTLDGVSRTLDGEALVVADADRAVALAGIIGGRDTEIGVGTTTVLLEAACWDPPTIARAARRLGIRTEASARFERGVDPEAGPRAQARAASLLAEIAGGRVLGRLVDVYPKRITPRVIRLRPERAAAVLGVEIPRDEIIRILRALGCAVEGKRILTVKAPTFRPDLTREEDLIEEIIRIHGYDRVPLTLPSGATAPARLAPALRADRHVRETLTRCGLSEVMTLTLVSPEAAKVADANASPVMLQNPLAVDHSALRTSLLPGLVDVQATNASRRIGDVHIFELGRVFHSRGPGQRPEERRSLGIATMGRWRSGWNVPEEQVLADFYHLRGIIDTLLASLGVREWQVAAAAAGAEGWWHPGRAARVTVWGRAVASFGELHEDRASTHRLPHRAYLAELDLETLLELTSPPPVGVFTGLPRHPSVERDLAAIVPDDVAASQLDALIREAGGPLLEGLELFDVYTGPPVPPGHRSVAYRIQLRAPDRTLTTSEAEEIMGRIRIALRTRAGASLRG
jgi:phenylalanyl-tRNA synthetase beta chain